MAMIVVVIVTKAAILLHGALGSGPAAPALLTPARAATEHGQEAPKAPAAPPKPPAAPQAAQPVPSVDPKSPPDPPAISDSERALLQNLRDRRRELDARSDALNEREAVVSAAEQKLDARVTELKSLQSRLEVLDAEQKQKTEAGWQSMVKLYEAMKPRDAAGILNDLSLPVVLQVMDRMKDAKAAAVLSAMNPERARDVTAGLAQLRTGRDNVDAKLAGS